MVSSPDVETSDFSSHEVYLQIDSYAWYTTVIGQPPTSTASSTIPLLIADHASHMLGKGALIKPVQWIFITYKEIFNLKFATPANLNRIAAIFLFILPIKYSIEKGSNKFKDFSKTSSFLLSSFNKGHTQKM